VIEATTGKARCTDKGPVRRHRELYEAEYSWQELKLDALRERIGAELANRAPGATGDLAPRPGGEEDARKPAEGA
jgi:hypothetical protein